MPAAPQVTREQRWESGGRRRKNRRGKSLEMAVEASAEQWTVEERQIKQKVTTHRRGKKKGRRKVWKERQEALKRKRDFKWQLSA